MRTFRRSTSGQALLELALIMPMLLVFALGIIDFTRAIYDFQVITNLAGEGSSAASRLTPLTDTAADIMQYAGNDIAMSSAGCVIVTSVYYDGTNYKVSGQAISSPCNSGHSRIGCYPPPS